MLLQIDMGKKYDPHRSQIRRYSTDKTTLPYSARVGKIPTEIFLNP